MKLNARLSNKGQSLLSLMFVLILFLVTDVYLRLKSRGGAKMVLKCSLA
jgi:hypothetical protein